MSKVYIPWHAFLGDLWATCSWCIRESQRTGEPVLLSRMQHDQDLGARLKAILALLEGGERVTLVKERGTQQITGEQVWAEEVVPTRQRWHGSTERQVAYQFDGISSAREKNPPAEDVERLIASTPGVTWVRLGSHLSLEECVEVLASCQAFLGCDSGMSHLAHSVGTPMGVVEYDLPVITTHRGKPYKHLFRMSHAIDWIRLTVLHEPVMRGVPYPSVQMIIPTYARSAWLERALGSVLTLDYQGEVTALVLNDCPEQTLVCNHPRVSIINHPSIYPTIGHKRRALLQHATADWVGWLDDDDFVLPWHLDRLSIAQREGRPMAAHDEHVWMNGGAAELAGKHKLDLLLEREFALSVPYPLHDFQEDIGWHDMLQRSQGYFSATAAQLPASMATCWGQGLFHVSGQNNDQGYVAYRRDARERFARGLEPMGVVYVTPQPEIRMDTAVRCARERRNIPAPG